MSGDGSGGQEREGVGGRCPGAGGESAKTRVIPPACQSNEEVSREKQRKAKKYTDYNTHAIH